MNYVQHSNGLTNPIRVMSHDLTVTPRRIELENKQTNLTAYNMKQMDPTKKYTEDRRYLPALNRRISIHSNASIKHGM